MKEEDFNYFLWSKEWNMPLAKKIFQICNDYKQGLQSLVDIGKSPVQLLNYLLPVLLDAEEIKFLLDKKNDGMKKLIGMMIKQIICEDGEFEHLPNVPNKELPKPSNFVAKVKLKFNGKHIFKTGGVYIRIKKP